MKHIGILLVTVICLVSAQITFAQDDAACSEIIQTAYQTTETVCEGTKRDEACYGNVSVIANPQPNIDNLDFNNPGDVAGVASIASLRLGSMDIDAQQWGVSLLRIQANLPDDADQYVELLLFGDVEIENAVHDEQPDPVLIKVTALNDVNVRRSPSTNADIVGVIRYNETVTANGRNTAGDWLQVELPDDNGIGWVYAPLVSADDDLSNLLVVDADEVTYGPMQAFYFRTGEDDNPCQEVPESGILVQTPEGAGEITLLVNEVTIDLGSTAYLQTSSGSENEMRISVIEGKGVVSVEGETVVVPAGTYSTVALDENGTPTGTLTPAQPYDNIALDTLPIELLAREITIADPLTQEEIDAVANPDEGTLTGDPVLDYANICVSELTLLQNILASAQSGTASVEEAEAAADAYLACLEAHGVDLDYDYSEE